MNKDLFHIRDVRLQHGRNISVFREIYKLVDLVLANSVVIVNDGKYPKTEKELGKIIKKHNLRFTEWRNEIDHSIIITTYAGDRVLDSVKISYKHRIIINKREIWLRK